MTVSRSIHVSQMVQFHSFYGWAIFHYIYMYHVFIHSSVDGHLGCFHVLAIGKQCCSEHWTACIFWNSGFLWVYTQEWDCWTTVPSLAATLPCATSMPALLQPRVNHLRKSFESILSFPTARISGAPFCTPASSVPAVSASAPASPHSTWNPALSVRLPCGALWLPTSMPKMASAHPYSPSTPSRSTYFRETSWTTPLFLHLPYHVEIISLSVYSPQKTVSCQRTGALTPPELSPQLTAPLLTPSMCPVGIWRMNEQV